MEEFGREMETGASVEGISGGERVGRHRTESRMKGLADW